MQDARQNLLNEWKQIGDRVFDKLTSEKWGWMPDLDKNDPTWALVKFYLYLALKRVLQRHQRFK